MKRVTSLYVKKQMDFLEINISKKTKAIPKGKAIVPYWTKKEFEAIISQICILDLYEHLNFVMLWLYYITGVRVNKVAALWWDDVDFKNKRL